MSLYHTWFRQYKTYSRVKDFEGSPERLDSVCVHQWCANPGISNPNPDPNPDTSNPAESEYTPFFLNPNPKPTALHPNPDSNPVLIEKLVGVWTETEISNLDSNPNPNPPFFPESGFLHSSSESESSPKTSESGFGFAHHWCPPARDSSSIVKSTQSWRCCRWEGSTTALPRQDLTHTMQYWKHSQQQKFSISFNYFRTLLVNNNQMDNKTNNKI